jgi:hypothetical protein
MDDDEEAPGGPALEEIPLNPQNDTIYAAVLAEIPTFDSIQECQREFELEKQILYQIANNVETEQRNSGENRDIALINLQSWIRVHSRAVQERRPNMTAGQRVPHLVFPEASVKNIYFLLDLYRTLEHKASGSYWNTIVDGQTLKRKCMRCLARLYDICQQAKKFTEPTASPHRYPVETYWDHENVQPEQEPTGEPTGEPAGVNALLFQLKCLM